MLLGIPRRLGLRNPPCIPVLALALTILLGSCTEPAEHPTSPLTPPERLTSTAQKPPQRQVDVAPLAAVHKAKPTDPAAALAYARALRESGATPQALAVLDKTSALRPSDKRLLFERGLLALELGEPAKAEALLQKANDEKAPSWRLHSALGAALASRGKQQEAQVQFAKALALAPDHPSILNNLALSYALDGKAEEAEKLLRKARQARSTPDLGKVQQNLALVLGLRGKYEEARVAAADALTSAKAQENVAYLQDLASARSASAQAEKKPDPGADAGARRASASLPQPTYQLGGPPPASK
jgi:Flp pilus assembly protein TadD